MSQTDNLNNECKDFQSTSKDAHAMNIGKAKELFNEYGDDFVSELENVATVFRNAKVSAPLPNGNFLHALCLTRVMLRNTVNSFQMLTGGAGGGFIRCLIGDFRKMLERLRTNKGEAKIIVVGNQADDCGLLTDLAVEFSDCLKVAYASSREPIRHYIVADGDMVRDEQVHPALNDESDADSVVANVYFRNSNVAGVFMDRFRMQWTAATAAN